MSSVYHVNNHVEFDLDITPNTSSAILAIVSPLLQQARHKLLNELLQLSKTYNSSDFDMVAIEGLLFKLLSAQLFEILKPTITLELNVARLRGDLKGETSEQRFESFVQKLSCDEYALAILREYSALEELVKATVEHWQNFSLEFITRLLVDWEEIKTRLHLSGDNDSIITIDSTGDRHRYGKSVLIIKFKSGHCLVYKPRSLATDEHFQELLCWLNAKSIIEPLYLLKVINKGAYGWTEYIHHQACSSPEGINRFYRRLGIHLAILYILSAGDFHSENLIAMGEHPVLIDLETLFHPFINSETSNIIEQFTNRFLSNSVVGTGLLPDHIWDKERLADVDFSGIKVLKQKLTSTESYLDKFGTDEMQIKRKQVELSEDLNYPSLNSSEINILDYKDMIIDGFTYTYHTILKHKNELLSADGLLARFANNEVRFVPRNSSFYELLLRHSFHPDLLRSTSEREHFFDKLNIGVEHFRYLAKLVPFEKKALWVNDIPIFNTKPNSDTLWSSNGDPIPNFFTEPSIDVVRHRILAMGESDLSHQKWLINASILTSLIGQTGASYVKKWNIEIKHGPNIPSICTPKEQLLDAACTIADRLRTLSIRNAEHTTWFGLKQFLNNKWSFVPLGNEIYDLYDDIGGVILFFAYLGKITQRKEYTETAQAAFEIFKKQLNTTEPLVKTIGSFYGLGGIIYILSHLSVLWNQPHLLSSAEGIVQSLPELIQEDVHWGVLSGAAGAINSLRVLYPLKNSPHILRTMIQCGEHLIAGSVQTKEGIGWIQNDVSTIPMTGMAYGNAGIAWSLFALAEISQEKKFYEAAISAINYERSVYSQEYRNWPDFRDPHNSENRYKMVAWCHGAPGIGLARIQALKYFKDRDIVEEIQGALQTTLNKGFGFNHSLCHGDLGNLEFLLQSSDVLNDSRLQNILDHHALTILNSINQYGYLCGVPLEIETPGLMTGLAGIGYGLLRLAAPDRVPSVLTLEPPRP